MCKTVTIGSPQDFGAELSRAIKQKNKLVLRTEGLFFYSFVFVNNSKKSLR
jgi:hypothetical protein